MTAEKIVALALGFIAGVVSYGFYEKYLLVILAVIAAIATGLVAYGLVMRFFKEA